ncbi:MAG: TIGR03905 family TSCPD domain-containing protein [Paludibacteraceae bacterium]|nr:TIGR03905 family TSCPD domain-containing protein [Paludibacteraceae bacterium]MBR4839014.1 TIGR03905 family TSCPD domain-containing protein [Paludibacteraceae bacterium]
MEVTKTYPCVGTCSKMIIVTVDEGIIKSAQIIGGCPGNTQGVTALVAGMKVEDAIARLKGIDCGGRGTSCPDQFAKALEKFL